MVRRSWTFGLCENCLKNSHEEVKMVKITLISDYGKKEEMWCCPVCGSTKRL
jgi:DNA primase catalytic subunit